jgi:hypothetical protein
MAQTLCIKCGSELKPSSYCELCKQPLIFTCTSCDYITEEKVHADCRNAKELTKNTVDATTDLLLRVHENTWKPKYPQIEKGKST